MASYVIYSAGALDDDNLVSACVAVRNANLGACHTLVNPIGVHEQKQKEKELSSGALPFQSSKFAA